MKRLLALIIATGLLLPLAVGCGDDKGGATKDKDKAKPSGPPPNAGSGAKDKGGPAPAPAADKKDK